MSLRKPHLNKTFELNKSYRIATITAKWNIEYNQAMQTSAVEVLSAYEKISQDHFTVPGAFEIPVIARKLIATNKYDAIICFATIIRGDTYHFEIVANESAHGLMQLMVHSGVPIINGILTTNNEEQALQRASASHEDKGSEFAYSLLETLSLLETI